MGPCTILFPEWILRRSRLRCAPWGGSSERPPPSAPCRGPRPVRSPPPPRDRTPPPGAGRDSPGIPPSPTGPGTRPGSSHGGFHHLTYSRTVMAAARQLSSTKWRPAYLVSRKINNLSHNIQHILSAFKISCGLNTFRNK